MRRWCSTKKEEEEEDKRNVNNTDYDYGYGINDIYYIHTFILHTKICCDAVSCYINSTHYIIIW